MRFLTAGLLALGLSTTLACGDKDGDDSGGTGGTYDDILALTGDSAAGATVFGDTCAACHGADGTGDSGPSLVDAVPGYGDEDLLSIMLEGKGSMGAVALSDQEAADVLAYLNETF
ncbi:cytochrome c [Myxococcota bacterium]|nr:cytochrome c [Myxococcota bacterium]